MAKVTIHGPRGSGSYSSKNTQIFGGNSSNTVIESHKGTVLMMDAGYGMVAAQQALAQRDERPAEVHLMFSHPHHDHIEGLAVTDLPYAPGAGLVIHATPSQYRGLKVRNNGRNFPAKFPQDMRGLGEDMLRQIDEPKGYDTVHTHIDDIIVDSMRGNHPGGVLLHRVRADDVDIVYATDNEISYVKQNGPNSPAVPMNPDFRLRYLEFIRGANTVIADGQWKRIEYEQGKWSSYCRSMIPIRGWGHTYAEEILDIAAEAEASHVIITHHDLTRSDDELFRMEDLAVAYCNERGYKLTVEFARQEHEIDYDMLKAA